ncbi:RDD family protein [Bacillus sp. FJAT-49711]|uniref:RDD family protein n=1 Tax=Bacillus sp. FJAT-49711 TaxID=2833585 RepID=UPI001BCA4A74|nr:RDD family protein [Bacillus sp. FJAT-49711]MBS4216835.1 RDD family protein [Bacillus sp. FJAT-49711]
MIENDNQIVEKAQSPAISYHYAGFWMRFWAYLLDGMIVFSINGILVKPLFRGLGVSLSDSGFISPYGITAGLIFYLYFILMTKFYGQTLGKMVFGLKVVPLKGDRLTWGTIIFREGIGRYISATFNFLYAVVAFTPKKQGLHDIFADTTVVHERTKIVEPAYS